MGDERIAAQHVARAVLAAALIQSKIVDISSVFFDGQAVTEPPAPSIAKLKTAVDILVREVVHK